MRNFIPLTLAATLLLAAQLHGAPITFTELGDAGNNIATAQIIYGTGSLDEIVGLLNAPGDTTGAVDVFEIYISDPHNFSAITSGGVPDPELFLFDVNGRGYEGGRDYDLVTGDLRGFLIGDSDPASPPVAAYLWISLQAREPGCNGSAMFGAGGTQYPNVTGPASNCMLTGPIGGANSNNPGTNYAYTINLTGVSFMPVPEPASASLLALGLLAFALGRLRR